MVRYLDDLPITSHQLGHGGLGLHGQLGWSHLPVSIRGIRFAHAISAHAPSRVEIDLDEPYDYFSCRVAINDTGIAPQPEATFLVHVEGRIAARVANVTNNRSKVLQANISGARRIELSVQAQSYPGCHSVWLDPHVGSWTNEGWMDSTGQVRVYPPSRPIEASQCVVTMVSPGYERWLDILLNSLRLNGNCPDAQVVVFCVNGDEHCREVILRHHGIEVPCEALVPLSAAIRPAIFSIGRMVPASTKLVLLETDMIVLEDISALFDSLSVFTDQTFLVARELHWEHPVKIQDFFQELFHGTPDELSDVFNANEAERNFDLQINPGIIAGTAEAIVALDNTIYDLCPLATQWIQARPDLYWREMFVINLAMARMNTTVRLHPSYNVQLLQRDIDIHYDETGIWASFEQGRAKVLHFNGSRHKYPELQSRFGSI